MDKPRNRLLLAAGALGGILGGGHIMQRVADIARAEPRIKEKGGAPVMRQTIGGGWKPSHSQPHQGKREIARRQAQIAKGQLRVHHGPTEEVSNGATP